MHLIISRSKDKKTVEKKALLERASREEDLWGRPGLPQTRKVKGNIGKRDRTYREF